MFNDRSIARFFIVISAIFLLVCVSRLVYLQIYEHSFYEKIVDFQTKAGAPFVKDRGYIYDRNGVVLAKNKKVASLYVFGKDISDTDKFVADLKNNGIVLNNDTINNIKNKDSFVWVMRHLDIEKAKNVKSAVPAIGYSLEDSRFYPEGNTLAGIIGYTGVDNQGLSGVEFFADSLLKGKTIAVNTIKDSRGRLILFDDSAINTQPDSAVYLSMDLQLQSVVDEILKADLENFQAKTAIAIAMDVQTGEIIISSAVERRMGKAVIAKDKNYATTYLFEPGSIFKAVTFGFLIENNLYDSLKKLDTSKSVNVYGHQIKDVYKYGMLTEEEVFTKSSNIGTVLLTGEVKNSDIHAFISKAGFGRRTGSYGVSEESGILRDPAKWSGLSLASVSIGQEIMVTPVQMLRYYAAVGNKGVAVKPRFIRGTVTDNRYIETGIEAEKVLSESTAAVLLKMLEETVVSGTGKRAASGIVKIGGKTGTAQIADPSSGGYSKVDYIASFAGVFPVNEPKIALIIIYENPRTSIYGGVSGASSFKKIAEQIVFHFELGNDRTKVLYVNK